MRGHERQKSFARLLFDDERVEVAVVHSNERVVDDESAANFVCVVALDEDREVEVARGICENFQPLSLLLLTKN